MAPPGSNGALIILLTLDAPGTTTGTFSGGTPLTAGQWTDMLAGNTYIRIGSTVFPSGEIRGQLTLIPEPSSLVLLGFGLIGALAAGWRRRRTQ